MFVNDDSGKVLNKHNQPIDLMINDIIHLESAPDGIPLLTEYRVEKKVIKIDMTGGVHYEYTINQWGGPMKQKHFIQ